MSRAAEKRGWRDGLGGRARLLLAVSAAVSVAGWMGGVHWFLELFSHFIAWYALGSAVLAAILWFCGSRRAAVVAGLLSLLQAFQPLSWYGPAPEGARATSTEPVRCRVLLANVLSENQDTERLLALVARTDPDIVCVQEVTARWEAALEALEEVYPVHQAVPRPDNFGIAMYSRMPGPLPEVLFQQEHGLPALGMRIDAGGGPVHLLNIHAVPPAGGGLARRRDAQLASARSWLAGKNGPAILIGDLNLTMFSPVYRAFVAETGVRNARAGFGPLGTWPAWVPGPRLPLDHCLVRGAIDVTACRTGPEIGSDHLPLLVDLHLPGAPEARNPS